MKKLKEGRKTKEMFTICKRVKCKYRKKHGDLVRYHGIYNEKGQFTLSKTGKNKLKV